MGNEMLFLGIPTDVSQLPNEILPGGEDKKKVFLF
jgi:hypothetical protein